MYSISCSLSECVRILNDALKTLSDPLLTAFSCAPFEYSISLSRQGGKVVFGSVPSLNQLTCLSHPSSGTNLTFASLIIAVSLRLSMAAAPRHLLLSRPSIIDKPCKEEFL